MAVTGYSPGVGRSFTPSNDATWTDKFNKLLQEHNKSHKYSRNRFTEKCIELGMEALNNPQKSYTKFEDCISIPLDGLSEDHIKFLSSPEGMDTVSGIVKMLLIGNTQSISFTQENQYIQKNKEEASLNENNEAAVTLEDISDNKTTDNEDQLESFFDKINKLGGI